jgi:cation transport protein ChaC
MTLRALKRQTPEQMRASLADALADWNGRDPLWIFAYGSLIWNPELDFDRRWPARVHGYHRRLCLRSIRNRGTVECPGLVAGLDRGGSCNGIVYRIPAPAVHAQFEQLWEREMFMGSYRPSWLHCHRLDRPQKVTALAFVVRRDVINYCGKLPESEVIEVLSRACGLYGTSLEYLQRTVRGLREAGLHDPHFERLVHRVERALAIEAQPSSAERRASAPLD